MKLQIPIIYFMIIPILIFVITSIILYLLLSKTSSRFRNATLRIKIALDIGLSHFIFTVFIIILGRIIDQTQNHALGMLYSYANVFEYPFFLITPFLIHMLRNILPHEIYSVIVSFISFSIIGSLFYGYFALFIGYLFGKIKGSMGNKTIILIISTILLGIMLLTGSAIIFPTRALLFMETMILKSGAKWENPLYVWFYFPVHHSVLSLANYGPLSNNAISDGVLKIIQDDTIDDRVRTQYVLDIRGKFSNLNNKRIEVDEEVREKVYPALIKIIEDKNNESRLRAYAAQALISIGRRNEEIMKYTIRLLDDKDDLVKEETLRFLYWPDNEINDKLISMLKNRQQYSENVIYAVIQQVTNDVNKLPEAMPYIIEMLNETRNIEDFQKIARSLQEYDDPKVMDPIIQKLTELKLPQYERKYFLKNSVLLDYLPLAKKEDKLLVLMLIEETYYQLGGNVETPSHYGKAVDALKPCLTDPNRKIQLIALNIYEEVVASIKSTTYENARKEGMSKLGDIKSALTEKIKEINDAEAKEYVDSIKEGMSMREVIIEKGEENYYLEIRKRINCILDDINVLEEMRRKIQG